MRIEDVNEGDLITFMYVQQSGNGRWYRWIATGVYIGRQKDEWSDQVIISFRPKLGTSYFETKEIDRIDLIKTARDRIGQRGDDGVMLPRRMPGAVTARS